jgi:pimeloyl-ACP methyl ester carboxylesterase
MKVNGTGGYAGSIPYARLAQDIGDGFVTAGSNMGHDGGESASWTLGHPEKVKDWGLRAHYFVATAAKTLSQAFYDKPVDHSYFEGCSNGGRQAMMMAQNYPELFDGIVAGAPSMWYPDLLMWLLWTGKTLTPTVAFGPPSISTAKRNAITQRAMAACDANDGLADGQITNPRACTFNIDSMGPSGDGTLTADEVLIAKRMYGGTHRNWDDLTSEQRYTGAKYGSEADWSPLFADNGGYGPFIGHYVYSLFKPAVRLAPRRKLGQCLRLRQASVIAGYRGAEPRHHGIRRTWWEADRVPRLERFGRAARWIARKLLRADSVREAASPAQSGFRRANRQAHATSRRSDRRSVWPSGGAILSPVHDAGRCALWRQHGAELDRRRRT